MNTSKMVRISDFCTTGSGGTPARQNARYYRNGTIPWVKSGELREDIINNAEEFITFDALKETSVKMVPKNSLLLAMYGATVGRLAILGIPATTNQAICHIIPNAKVAEVRYLFHALRAQVEYIISQGVGGAQPNINQSIVKNLEVRLPSLEEQRRTIELLDKSEDLKVKRINAIGKINLLIKAIFLEMFGDPVRNNLSLPITTLDQIGDWHSGGTPPRSKASHFIGEIPWFSSGELEKVFVDDSKEHISEFALKYTAAKLVSKGSLMLGMYDTAALKSSIALRDCSCNQAIAFAQLDPKKVETLYVYWAIQIAKEHLKLKQRGVRQKNLNLTIVKNIEIPLPDISKQKEFVSKLAKITTLRDEFNSSLIKAEELFLSVQRESFGCRG